MLPSPRALLLPGVLLLVLSGCASVRPPEQEQVRVRTRSSTRFYAVHGTTSSAIFADIDRNGLFDHKGHRAVAVTSAQLRVDWQGVEASRGPCSAGPVTITVALAVTLPRHERPDALAADVKARWQRFAARVTAHERRHVDIYLDGARAMKTRVREELAKRWLSCSDLEKNIHGVWASQEAEIERVQDRFHADDDAEIQNERKTLQAQIDANQARLSAMQSEIRDLDRTIKDLGRRLDASRATMDALTAEMAESNASLSTCSQPGATRRVRALCQRHNDLAAVHNTLVARDTEIVSRHNKLVGEHNRIAAVTNDLIEALNWTR